MLSKDVWIMQCLRLSNIKDHLVYHRPIMQNTSKPWARIWFPGSSAVYHAPGKPDIWIGVPRWSTVRAKYQTGKRSTNAYPVPAMKHKQRGRSNQQSRSCRRTWTGLRHVCFGFRGRCLGLRSCDPNKRSRSKTIDLHRSKTAKVCRL